MMAWNCFALASTTAATFHFSLNRCSNGTVSVFGPRQTAILELHTNGVGQREIARALARHRVAVQTVLRSKTIRDPPRNGQFSCITRIFDGLLTKENVVLRVLLADTLAVGEMYVPLGRSASAVSSEAIVDIPGTFTIRVLSGPSEHNVAASAIRLMGRRLIAQVSELLKPDDCFRIDCTEALVLGEVLGCWHEESEFFAAMDLQQVLMNNRATLPYFAPIDRHASPAFRKSA